MAETTQNYSKICNIQGPPPSWAWIHLPQVHRDRIPLPNLVNHPSSDPGRDICNGSHASSSHVIIHARAVTSQTNAERNPLTTTTEPVIILPISTWTKHHPGLRLRNFGPPPPKIPRDWPQTGAPYRHVSRSLRDWEEMAIRKGVACNLRTPISHIRASAPRFSKKSRLSLRFPLNLAPRGPDASSSSTVESRSTSDGRVRRKTWRGKNACDARR